MNDRSHTSPRIPDTGASELGLAGLSAAATLLFLQAFRVFVPYLVFEIDQSQRQQLAAIGLAVFGLAFLGALLYRLAGGRAALWIAVATLIAARLAFQFTGDPGLRWMLGAVAVIGWCWVLIVLLPQAGGQLGLGIGFAFAIDLIIRGFRATLDLPWMPGIAAHLTTIAIAGVVALSAWLVTTSNRLDGNEAGFVTSLRFAGIGSGVALWLVVAGNLGFAEVQGDIALPASFALLALGTLLALASHFGIIRLRPVYTGERSRGIVHLLLLVSALAIWNSGSTRLLDLILIPVFAYAVSASTMHCSAATSPGHVRFRWRTGATLTLGLLMQTVFVFLYFARSGPILLMLVPAMVVSLASFAGRPSGRLVFPIERALIRTSAAVALLSIAAFGWLFVHDAGSGPAARGTGTLTAMTFNIQEGFSNGDIWSLETTARTIEAHDPDIVFLQEVTRGWLVMSSVDEVRWLADRLDMHVAWAGNSHDGLWGNAILSRFPIVSERSIVYSTTDNLRRGALGIEVTTSSGPMLAIDTHLDNPLRATPVRLEQIQELIDFWGGATPAIIAGDFNADPGSQEWQAMIDAGFVDTAGSNATPTSEDDRRIDYIWITPDQHVERYDVPGGGASDHRPVVVSLALSA